VALLRTVSTGIVGSVMIAALQRDRSDPDRQLAYPFELAYFAIRIEFIKRTLNIFKNSCCGSASEMPIYVSNLQIGPLPRRGRSFSRAPAQPNCRSFNPASSHWSSISRPPSRSASQFRTGYSPSLTRWSNKRAICCNALVGLWHKADIPTGSTNVRFWGYSGHRAEKRTSSSVHLTVRKGD
jgi:hypothetical protein